MIDLFKYVSNIYDTSRPNFTRNVDGRTRGHSRKLMKNRSRLQQLFLGESHIIGSKQTNLI